MARKLGRRSWALLAFGVMTLGGLAAAGAVMAPSEAPTATAERPAQPVRVTPVAFDASARIARHTGTIRPRQEVALSFRLPGKIVARDVEVGDRVTAGQVIARLDDADTLLELELAQAEATASAIDLNRARADAARAATLFADGHIPKATFDRATSGEAEAAARADRAARALALAQNRLDYTQLRAEVDGIVIATPGEAGQVVAAGQPIVAVAKGGAADVVFQLPEQDRALIGQATARAELWGDAAGSYALTLRDISPDVDPAGRTYRVRMAITAPDDRAAFGRTVTVDLLLPAEAPTATLPLAAVLNDGSGAAVWRVDPTGARVDRIPVEVVAVTESTVRLRGALAEGDRVVSLGAHKIDPARPVRVVETAPTPEG
ncbi:MAG: efflux RND transporter periplasmic adaptor subunit [Rhodobacteraceae bacterium]|nr:efflux RND transporter periplasmic adaptor subunit [Paracoccaceae bacterium]